MNNAAATISQCVTAGRVVPVAHGVSIQGTGSEVTATLHGGEQAVSDSEPAMALSFVVIPDNPFYDYRTTFVVKEEKTMKMIKRFFKEDDGATLVEYAILVALIAVAVIATVVVLGTEINNAFQSVVTELQGAGS